MFDTMTITKAGGALCGALLIFLLGKWAAEELYHTGGGHGKEEHAAGYVIEIESDDTAEEPAGEVDLAAVLAAGNADEGAKVFSKCRACHKVEKGANGTGPYLYGVVGRAVDSAEGYGGYSGALAAATDAWTPEALYAFLENPRGYAPGNKMSFAGLKKSEERADVIAYLDSLDN